MPRLSDFVAREYLVKRKWADKSVRFWTPIAWCLAGIMIALGGKVGKLPTGLVCALVILVISDPMKHMTEPLSLPRNSTIG